ncbi:hypothetical protein [Edaphobacter modestus]|uniref:SmpA/OmlA family protein n=1 Tax=Edaphobacter modestus TaxID=388466 RepID=A0A4Q7Z088_9BACT|nr:hypothetical protein [Edaphobacter modestus]RZU43508.1 hypothetical protein BDD14_5175 [Edaphobacter modestus]
MNWKAILAIVVVLVLVTTAVGFVRDSRIEADFPALRAKSSEADVRRIMGDPKQIQKPCDAYGTSVTPECNHVFIYRSTFYPVRDKYWLVFFNENNQVTATSSQQ